MGVTGLWTVVQPCARPIKLETLNKKRLAVDASIWIYQFLKAVRDKEGNALRNSHVVGFFRRICKLLFVGILPVFVFDGGAPTLKRQTINNRKRRREGRKEDAIKTAGKLLALQMQRAAEDEEAKRKRERDRQVDEEEIVDESKLVYVDELQMTQQERMQNRKFRKKDQYHLPDLEASMAEMGGANDPRIMSLEELEAYARQFDTGEDINVYDFSKIDFDSPFFTSLPASDRYNILNAARLRSRLRMGYSKEQLDSMFPNRMDFSRFQIERVAERNELTQRLMNINGMNDDGMWGINGTGRIAGEKGREYVLVRNEGVEGGWALGVVSGRDEGERDRPIDVDELGREAQRIAEEDEQSEDDFEDVPIEGLNRLPKSGYGQSAAEINQIEKKRRRLYASRKSGRSRKPRRTKNAPQTDADSLFVAEQDAESSEEEAVEDDDDLFAADEDEELNRAIAMSLEKNDSELDGASGGPTEDGNYLEVFQQKRVEDAPNFKGTAGSSGLAVARQVNARATRLPKSTIFQADSDSEEEAPSQLGGIENRQDTVKGTPKTTDEKRAAKVQAAVLEASKPKPKSTGPLPFEKLDLGNSLFGKKVEKMQENTAGGFEKTGEKKQETRSLPPWFAGNPDEDTEKQKAIERADRERAKKYKDDQKFQFEQPSVLHRHGTEEVIDLEAEEPQSKPKTVLVIDEDTEPSLTEPAGSVGVDNRGRGLEQEITMGDIADTIKVAPPNVPTPPDSPMPAVVHEPTSGAGDVPSSISQEKDDGKSSEPEAELQWSESEPDDERNQRIPWTAMPDTGSVVDNHPPSRSASPDFEDVQIPAKPDMMAERRADLSVQAEKAAAEIPQASGLADQNALVEDDEEYGLASDSEDGELMRQLEIEAQEHARFASELNQKSQQQNIVEYERELKQLRTQQKKDRRDADEVTQIMITECQQLLRLFGLPYITAPMEAEAQCAELVHLGLVDGIVTDDSDCFLFGGTRIYKNMFNQAKFVECYLLSDLEKEFDLTRQKLIGIAQLLGSDYTEGLHGVGPVTALEILSEFPDLRDFERWWAGVQEGRIKKEDDQAHPFRRKFRKTNAAKLFLPTGFPDPRVEEAYLRPEVDSDPSEFQWGVPDLDALRSFLMATVGWGPERTDEVLVPVIRDMNRRQEEGTQSNITKFFGGGTGAGAAGYAPRVRARDAGKRIGGALGRMAARARQKRGERAAEGEQGWDGGDGGGGGGGGGGDDEPPEGEEGGEEAEKTAPRSTRKRKSKAGNEHADDTDRDAGKPGTKKRKAAKRGKRASVVDEDGG